MFSVPDAPRQGPGAAAELSMANPLLPEPLLPSLCHRVIRTGPGHSSACVDQIIDDGRPQTPRDIAHFHYGILAENFAYADFNYEKKKNPGPGR